jgi:hypothetical protein
MGNTPNYNKLSIIAATGFSDKEIENFKNFIVKAVSKYDDYRDISDSIFNDCNKLDKDNKINWSVIVGLRDNMNANLNCHGSLAVNIGKYKIIIAYNPV